MDGNSIALALQGFGAGLQGRGGQFMERQERLSKERKQAMAADLRSANDLVKNKNFDAARKLLQERGAMVEKLGGDPSQTTQMLGEIGNIENLFKSQKPDLMVSGDSALTSLTGQLDAIDSRAVDTGLLAAKPGMTEYQKETLALAERKQAFEEGKTPKQDFKIVGGQAISKNPQTGEITATDIVNFKDIPEKTKIKSANYLPGGLVQITDVFGDTKVIKPTAEEAALIKDAERNQIDLAGAKKSAEAAGSEGGRGQEQRIQTTIGTGMELADAIPNLRRTEYLLKQLKTGGIDKVGNAIRSFAGIEGANEAELSNRMGKAVLQQLKATFGSAFTEGEGARLERIEAGFSKSTEGNLRLIQSAYKTVERAVRRGLHAAKKSGDEFAVEELQSFLDGAHDLKEEDFTSTESAAAVTVKTPVGGSELNNNLLQGNPEDFSGGDFYTTEEFNTAFDKY